MAVKGIKSLHLVEKVRRGLVALVPFEQTMNKNLKEEKMKEMSRRVRLVSCHKILKWTGSGRNQREGMNVSDTR